MMAVFKQRLFLLALTLALVFVAADGYFRSSQVPRFPGWPVAAKTRGAIWPKPQEQTTKSTVMLLTPSLQFHLIGSPCPLLEEAFVRYWDLIFGKPKKAQYIKKNPYSLPSYLRGYLNTVEVHVSGNCEIWPHLNMDEMYEIKIDTDDLPQGAKIIATTIWGALRGLESFSQLVYQDPTYSYVVNSTQILDFPRFSHRGILLDSSRHFLSKRVLLLNLDAMAYNKLNVFHWHIVDDTSFPYQSQVYPELSRKGAYNPVTHVYTLHDVVEVIEYARLRGIRVMVEFDTPGHTASWGIGYPELLTPCYKNVSGTLVPDGTTGPLNPILNSTYTFLTAFFTEVARVFPDSYIHLGGDEVPFECWMSNPDIRNFMEQMGFGTDVSKLEEYYISNLLDIVSHVPGNKSYVVWQEIVDNGVHVKDDTVVHVWRGDEMSEMHNVTAKGLRAILSSCWYLDYVDDVHDWQKFYKCEPLNFNGTAQQKALVMGGEACLWGEFVDSNNAMPRLWPRASGPAERLWSNVNVTDTNEAGPRLEEHRCRMVARGVDAEPQSGPSFCANDHLQ